MTLLLLLLAEDKIQNDLLKVSMIVDGAIIAVIIVSVTIYNTFKV